MISSPSRAMITDTAAQSRSPQTSTHENRRALAEIRRRLEHQARRGGLVVGHRLPAQHRELARVAAYALVEPQRSAVDDIVEKPPAKPVDRPGAHQAKLEAIGHAAMYGQNRAGGAAAFVASDRASAVHCPPRLLSLRASGERARRPLSDARVCLIAVARRRPSRRPLRCRDSCISAATGPAERVRRDCSVAKKQASRPALLAVVRSESEQGLLGDACIVVTTEALGWC